MPVIKCKPTSPGRRFVVKVVHPDLHKGAPFAALTTSKSKTGGRNNKGRITTRHVGGGHKQKYRIIDFKRNTSIHELQKMTDVLYHRGPDGSGYELIEKENYVLGFGHRRLSIIDLTESGAQPMCFQEFWITFNCYIFFI